MAARSTSSTGPAEESGGFVTADQFGALTESLNNTMNDLKRQFGIIDSKFTAVEQRVVIIEQVVTAELSELKQAATTHQDKIKEHDEKLHFLNTKAMLFEEAASTLEASFQHFMGDMSSSINAMRKIEDVARDMMPAMGRIADLEILMGLAENTVGNHSDLGPGHETLICEGEDTRE